MKFLLFGTAMLAATTLSARAADMAVAEPPTEAPITEVSGIYDWNGFYVGGNVGYGWTDGDFSAGGASSDPSLDGWLAGLHAGYNYQSGNWVGGVEADIKHDFNDQRFGVAGTPYEAQTEWGGSVRARAGYAFDRTLLYATGGWAFTNAEVTNRTTGDDDSKTLHGWTIGAGVEHAITDNMTGRLEYRYTDYQDKRINGVKTDLDSNAVMMGVSWKF
ncbi:porin family protein [Rhizobium sp. TRM95111]|uniref:outer membrane protein n=1 Tax=Rhizobium alarense TaxID=2846851 RepID=UPI001F463306|nr:outer membrane protein [Rhizobium alarense]MCF3639358.1 porin family protein [Rhizobium alarense]